MTFSPKVFIPLTRLCNDTCGDCTFATSPAHVPSPFMSIDEVLSVARAGAHNGCHEGAVHVGRATRGPLRGRPRMAARTRVRLDRALRGVRSSSCMPSAGSPITAISTTCRPAGSRSASMESASSCRHAGTTWAAPSISRAAGAIHGHGKTPAELADLVAPLARPLVQRTTLYGTPGGHRPALAESGERPLSTSR